MSSEGPVGRSRTKKASEIGNDKVSSFLKTGR